MGFKWDNWSEDWDFNVQFSQVKGGETDQRLMKRSEDGAVNELQCLWRWKQAFCFFMCDEPAELAPRKLQVNLKDQGSGLVFATTLKFHTRGSFVPLQHWRKEGSGCTQGADPIQRFLVFLLCSFNGLPLTPPFWVLWAELCPSHSKIHTLLIPCIK